MFATATLFLILLSSVFEQKTKDALIKKSQPNWDDSEIGGDSTETEDAEAEGEEVDET